MSRKNNKSPSDVEVFHIHGLIQDVAAALNRSYGLNPNNLGFTRLLAAADSYAHYRVKSMKFRVHSNNSADTTAVGYVGGVQDTLPSTSLQVLELLPSVLVGPAQQVPTNWVKVQPNDLAGPLPWYKSLLGTSDSTEEQPGFLVLTRATASTPIQVEVMATYEFKTAVAPANTPMMVKLASEVRAARLLAHRAREAAALRRAMGAAAALAASGDTATRISSA